MATNNQTTRKQNPNRRNILLITTDEQRFDTLGCNGNPYIQTPNLDQLASEGINFQNHFTSFAICTPARASILTGQYSRSHGAWAVGVTLPRETNGLAHWLTAAGYRCGLFGKAHFEGELSHYVERLEQSEPYYGFQHHAITEDNQVGPYLDWIRQEHPDYWEAVRNNTHEGVRDTPLPDLGPGKVKECYTSTAPEHLHQTAWITDRTIEFMRNSQQEDAPFFAWCSYVDPHHPWNPPEPFASMYDPAQLPAPVRKEGENEGLGNNYFHVDGISNQELQRLCAAYYAMISHIDAHIGRLLVWLAEARLSENTLVIFTSDHGDYNGDHGLLRKGWYLYDSLLRVPLIVRKPGNELGGRKTYGLTQHEDLAPSILDYLGLPIPPSVQGFSFAPTLKAAAEPPRDYAFFEQKGLAWSSGDGVVGIRNGPWKLLHYPDHNGFVLINSDEDPYEYRNLYGMAQHGPIREELQKELLRWLLCTPNYRLPKEQPW